ncbi:MAG: SLC13 family permease [Rhodospirillales bacterium]|nr:SLC13 family permease [Rhodospirillales bacterium]|tara:strand:- start:264 stop:1607 length:1344 start_codon:yes stop_codon:yes gene_type:complete
MALVLLLMPPPQGIEPIMMRAGAVIILAIGMWATAIVPSYFGSLIFLFAAVALAVAPPKVVFSGFHAGAMWLVFGGLVFGLGVKQTGLDTRLVRSLLTHFPKIYIGMIYGVFWVATSLALIVPSASGRVALLVPIMVALAKKLGFGEESKGRTGLILAASLGTMVPAFNILPANVPNMALYGAADSVLNIQLTYADYFLLNFPVMGVFALVVYPALIAVLFRDTPRHPDHQEKISAWAGDEKRLLLFLTIALLLWITDSLHGISPAWVALGAAILCLLPRIGMLPPSVLGGEINYGPLLFLAGVIGLGAVANHAGLGTVIAKNLMQFLEFQKGADFQNYTSISLTSIVVGLFTTMPAQPSIMVAMTGTLAQATGWSELNVIMASMTAWGVFPFFYQTPPVVVAVALGNLKISDVTKTLICYMILGVLIMLPLHFLWGQSIGMFMTIF